MLLDRRSAGKPGCGYEHSAFPGYVSLAGRCELDWTVIVHDRYQTESGASPRQAAARAYMADMLTGDGHDHEGLVQAGDSEFTSGI